MKESKATWKNNYRVHSFLCNNKGLIRLSSIAKFLQEIAWEHAEDCGAGYQSLRPEGLLWILYGLRMEINEFPVWNDNLSIETWGKKYENLFAYRDFEIKKNGNDQPVVKATSSWLLVDAKTHRPRRITRELHRIPALDRDALSLKPGLVNDFTGYDARQELKVLYSDIDIYDHVNNTSYIQYCINSSPSLQLNAARIKSFDIRYVQESRLDEKLIIKQSVDKFSFYFLGENSGNDKEVFRAKAEIKDQE